MYPQIIAQTNNYLVIDKPAGMATEPPSKNTTLREWLVEHNHIQQTHWQDEDRFGVVHRLDADTSGVIVWAKNPTTQDHLRKLWQGRAVKKTYLALVCAETPEQGTIEVSLMRNNKKDRQVVALLPSDKARPAITEYRRLAIGEYNDTKVSLVEAHPITGRTHQIRVHLKSIGHPIIGDNLYGEKDSRTMAEQLGLTRQFLHAWQIELEGKKYQAKLPQDLSAVLEKTNIKFEQLAHKK